MTNAFQFTKKALFALEIFKVFNFSLPLIFPLLAIAEFIGEAV